VTKDGSYHHGDLRAAVLRAALEVIAESGPGAVSLRELARRAGVSHAAPAHHFGDKAGLLTAVAAEGFELLADELTGARQAGDDYLGIGVRYVGFAVDHRAHFEVMYRPDLYHRDDPAVVAARDRAGHALYGGAGALADAAGAVDPRLVGVAAWSLMHGFVTLWLNGNLPPELGPDARAAAAAMAGALFRAAAPGGGPHSA
jgi:AcrR family transcriptional regulator